MSVMAGWQPVAAVSGTNWESFFSHREIFVLDGSKPAEHTEDRHGFHETP
jgi:hypothetical protein